MRIPSKEVPQADSFADVLRAVEAVDKGKRTYQEIGRFIGKGERQGRYYRLAAELLGFLRRQSKNDALLTPLGRELLRSEGKHKRETEIKALLSMRLMQRILPFLESQKQTSHEQIAAFLREVADIGKAATATRRVSTITSWLIEAGIAKKNKTDYELQKLPESILSVEFSDVSEPLFPKKFDLNEYKETSAKISSKGGVIQSFVDEQKRARARTNHRRLVEMMARKLRENSTLPRRNPLVDLAAEISGQIYIFEMKSTTDENAHAQVRKGIAQLYEYRYLLEAEQAQLCLVIEAPLSKKQQWLTRYLIEDRDVLLIWDGSNRFSFPQEIAAKLPFLK